MGENNSGAGARARRAFVAVGARRGLVTRPNVLVARPSPLRGSTVMRTAPDSPFHFLVVGAGRGGTSLLMGLLDSHSMLEVGFEMFSIDYLTGRRKARPSFFKPARKDRLLHDRVDSFRRACSEEAKKFPDRLWGNKITTEQIYGLEDHNRLNPDAKVDVLDYFFREGLSGVKVVFILRDGRTCVRSKVNRTGQLVELACARWKFSVEVYRYLRERHPDHATLRFEDLLQEPVGVLTEICDFLGVPFEQGMVKGTRNPKIPPQYRQDSFVKTKLALGGEEEKWHPLIAEELRYCGYL